MSTSAPAVPATPDAGQGSGGAAVQPVSGQGQGQSTSQGNSQQGQGGSGFNWGNFPNIPEGQRSLLEPHLRDIQGYITQMEQRQAPYRALMESVAPEEVENLVTFLSNYNQNPLATWLGLGGAIHEAGHIENPEFSVDAIEALTRAPAAAPDPTMPEWAQSLQQRLDAIQQDNERRNQEAQQQAATAEQAEQQRMLAEAHSTIAETLKNAGLPEGLVTPEMMTGAIVSHRGDIQAAAQSFVQYKEGLLKNWVEQNGKGPKSPTIVGGAPSVPQNGLRSRPGDEFRSASKGAEQYLLQNAAAQG